MDDMMKMMEVMDKKIDKMMEHIGCKLTADEYDKLPDEEKDKLDEQSIEENVGEKEPKKDDTEE